MALILGIITNVYSKKCQDSKVLFKIIRRKKIDKTTTVKKTEKE